MRGYSPLRTMASWKLGKYREEEVEVLVEDYDELLSSRHKAWIQVRLLDVEQTLKRLSPPHREAVFLVGFVVSGLPKLLFCGGGPRGVGGGGRPPRR